MTHRILIARFRMVALRRGLFAASAAQLAGAEEALDGPTLYTQRTCVACHGPDAKSPILPDISEAGGTECGLCPSNR